MDRRWLVAAGFSASALAALAVSFGSLTPSQSMPVQTWPDKVLHVQGYLAIVLPACLVRAGAWRWMVPAAFVLGAAIELIQPHVGRSGEWADLAANVVGIALGAALPGLWRRLRG